MKLTPLKPHPFTLRELDKMGERITSGKEDKRLIEENFEFHGAFISSEGSASVLLESYQISPPNVVTGANGTTSRTPPRHTFAEGMIMELAPYGEIEDFMVVPKY